MRKDPAIEEQRIKWAQSIAAIPESQFPDRALRVSLMIDALAGKEVYAYTPFGSDQYILWIDDGSNVHDCRHNPWEYMHEQHHEQQERQP